MRILIAFFLISSAATAQERMLPFFPDNFTHNKNLDTLTLNEFRSILKAHPGEFDQAYFDYGYEDPKDWVLVSETIMDDPETTRPRINVFDIDNDGDMDLILSFLGWNYYKRIYIYENLGKKYRCIYWDYLALFGIYEPENASEPHFIISNPACCTDPTDAFFTGRYNSKENKIEIIDSMTVNFYDFRPLPSTDSLFTNQIWEESQDTMYIATTSEGFETKGYYLPGAQLRKIRTISYDGYTLEFCEIKGVLGPKPDWVSKEFFPHSFAWLSKEKLGINGKR